MLRWSQGWLGLAIGVVLANCTVLASCAGRSLRPGWRRFEASDAVQRIEITVDVGSLTLVGAPAGTLVLVSRNARSFPESRQIRDDVDGGTLRIEARCGGAPGCRVDHELRVPPGVAVTVQLGDGDVEVQDVAGSLQIDVALGKVTGSGLAGQVVDVHTEGGPIDLGFVVAPTRLVAYAAAGDVSLRVPAGRYRCDVDPGLVGTLEVVCDASASATIAASTGVGKLRVRSSGRVGVTRRRLVPRGAGAGPGRGPRGCGGRSGGACQRGRRSGCPARPCGCGRGG